jgi:transcriptional regulator with XRE-family HTH domain
MEYREKDKIARLLRESRINMGYTQQELSEIAGVSLRSIQRIENAEVVPRMHTLKVLSHHLGFSAQLSDCGLQPGNIEGSDHVAPSIENKRSLLPLNHRQNIILSLGVGVVMALLIQAFVAQSPRFPETDFELLLLLAGSTIFYIVTLLFIWK